MIYFFPSHFCLVSLGLKLKLTLSLTRLSSPVSPIQSLLPSRLVYTGDCTAKVMYSWEGVHLIFIDSQCFRNSDWYKLDSVIPYSSTSQLEMLCSLYTQLLGPIDFTFVHELLCVGIFMMLWLPYCTSSRAFSWGICLHADFPSFHPVQHHMSLLKILV